MASLQRVVGGVGRPRRAGRPRDGGVEGAAGKPSVPGGAGELGGRPLGRAVAQDAVDARDGGGRAVGADACKVDGRDIYEYVSKRCLGLAHGIART